MCAVADRFHGYLRSVMLNVHPGVFLSMDLDAGTRQRVFQTLEEWWNADPRGSIVLTLIDRNSEYWRTETRSDRIRWSLGRAMESRR
jgi:CRISPR-associated endoribonuclease Cas2 subtype I-E